jgi:sugar phosphate isomerase/epimerase
MNPPAPPDLSRCAVHTITTRPWPIETAIENYARAGFGGISVWRDALDGRDIAAVAQRLRAAGLQPAALVRGGFFAAAAAAARAHSFADNRAALADAARLGAPMLVLVCGAVPGQPLELSRQQIRDGIAALLPVAEQYGVALAIEPLHPMYADDRSAINTLASANDLAESFASPLVGVAVDVYHLWWDPALEREIARCGANGNLLAFHVCDWRTPTRDLLHDRGLMGEGCIPIRQIRGWVEAAGFNGFNEVEIFSNEHWKENQEAWLDRVVSACRTHV